MKIPSIGNYLTQDSQTAIVEALHGDLCSGWVAGIKATVVWNRVTGMASTCTGFAVPALSIVSLTASTPPWYKLLAAGDTFKDEGGIVYTVVSVDESGRADIEWFSPSCKRLLRSQEHLSDRWIAAKSTPISVAAMKAPQVALWRERILKLIETAHRHTDHINHPHTLVSGGLRIAIGGGGGCVVLTKDGVEPVFLNSPEFVGAVDSRLKELETADLRYRDDANALLIEALLQ